MWGLGFVACVASGLSNSQPTNPNPQTTNPKPQTPNHKPQTTNPKPQTTNNKPQTPNHKPHKTMLGSTSQINNFMNMFGVQQGLSPEQVAKMSGTSQVRHDGKVNRNAKTNPIDSVTISPTANSIQQLLNMELQNSDQSSETAELDLTGLAQLKQRGDMLANMLQVKLKNFETNLITGMKSSGLETMQEMEMKKGDNGLLLMNDLPNKESIQSFLQNNSQLKEQFQEIAQFANILETLQQLGSDTGAKTVNRAIIPPAVQYTQQSQPLRSEPQRPDANFVLHIMRGQTSYSFE
jgi:hypothetical protein